jgi:hypothetical protein
MRTIWDGGHSAADRRCAIAAQRPADTVRRDLQPGIATSLAARAPARTAENATGPERLVGLAPRALQPGIATGPERLVDSARHAHQPGTVTSPAVRAPARLAGNATASDRREDRVRR